MKAKIGVELLRSKQVQPRDKKFEVYDTELKGFGLIVYPNTAKPDGKVLPGGKVYIARYRRPDGKQTMARIGRHTLFTPAQARDEAEKILRSVKDGIDPNAKVEIKNHTLKSFLDKEYQPWVEAHRKDGKATVARLNACFADFLGNKLDEITPWLVEKWRTGRLNDGKAPSTVNRDLVALKAMFSRAVEWGRIEAHPLTKVKPSKVDNSAKVRYLDEGEEQRLLQSLDDREARIRAERDNANKWREARGYPLFADLGAAVFADHLKPLVLVSLHTGTRRGELFGLTWEDIDLKRAILTVRGDVAKNSKTRHVPLNSVALKVLKVWKKQTPGMLVFPGKDGEQLDNVKKSWQGLLDAAAIVAFRWHDMRHHFASKLVMAGVDLNTVRELLGHSDLKMTLRYAHLAPEHKASAVAKLVK